MRLRRPVTADLRAHDNPVLRAALGDAERVVPLFVVDTGIRRTGFAVPNRAAFLADSLADLDAALRARGGRLVVRVVTWSSGLGRPRDGPAAAASRQSRSRGREVPGGCLFDQ